MLFYLRCIGPLCTFMSVVHQRRVRIILPDIPWVLGERYLQSLVFALAINGCPFYCITWVIYWNYKWLKIMKTIHKYNLLKWHDRCTLTHTTCTPHNTWRDDVITGSFIIIASKLLSWLWPTDVACNPPGPGHRLRPGVLKGSADQIQLRGGEWFLCSFPPLISVIVWCSRVIIGLVKFLSLKSVPTDYYITQATT